MLVGNNRNVDATRVEKVREAYDLALAVIARRLKGEDVSPSMVELAQTTLAQLAKTRADVIDIYGMSV